MKRRTGNQRSKIASSGTHGTAFNEASPPGLRERYNAALDQFNARNLALAERGLREILSIDPNHADSLHLLGLIGLQTGHLEAAADLVRRAVEVDGGRAAYRANLGILLHAIGRSEEAVTQYEQALSLEPDFAEAHMNLGNILQSQGNVEGAIARYEQALALKPQYPEAHMNLGNALQSLGRFDEAITHYQHALTQKPDYSDAHMNLGNALQSVGKLDEAVARYQYALTLKPDHAEACINLGNALQSLGRLDEAVARYQHALNLKPDHAEAHMNLGNALSAQRRYTEAMIRYERALAIRPDSAEALMNLGNALQATNRWEEAILRYQQALAIRPLYAEAHMNLGTAFEELGRVDEAAHQYAQALRMKPAYAEAHMNQSLSQLKRGNFSAGWVGHESRWQLEVNASFRRDFSQPQWRGEPLLGQRILLHGEQGLGDCIQFLRYVPLVCAAGGSVILEIPRPLLRLCSTLPGLDALVATGETLPAFDWHCPLMSLPLAFGTVLDTIPTQVPYLVTPLQAQEKAAHFPWPTEGMRVGLVWAGNRKYLKDEQRSIAFDKLAPLTNLPNIRCFSLQIGETDSTPSSNGNHITNLVTVTDDMADTAAAIQHLDLVIAVDTAVAHLAGALAKPVWILLAYQADWRWLTTREDSPWYPTARLFRQTSRGDWQEVIERVATALSLSGVFPSPGVKPHSSCA